MHVRRFSTYGYLSSRIAESSELADRLIVTPRVRDGLFLGGTGDLFGDDSDTGVRACEFQCGSVREGVARAYAHV